MRTRPDQDPVKSNLGSQFNHGVECKLRVLDSFGTDEIFNDRSSKINNNTWGKLGLNLKQFWTFYSHNKECLILLALIFRDFGVRRTDQDLGMRVLEKKTKSIKKGK